MNLTELLEQWQAGLADGSIVPYLGPGALADVTSKVDGRPMPAICEQLILAMNHGQPMAPKLMYEFPRAAMNVELKRGRSAVTRFLDATYGTRTGPRRLHDWLAALAPPYVIDINRDTEVQPTATPHRPHLLVLGCAQDRRQRLPIQALRLATATDYTAIARTQADRPACPSCSSRWARPGPRSSYIASDADYVDYITELMVGFAVPTFVKTVRRASATCCSAYGSTATRSAWCFPT